MLLLLDSFRRFLHLDLIVSLPGLYLLVDLGMLIFFFVFSKGVH
jgi:hypothetical protein